MHVLDRDVGSTTVPFKKKMTYTATLKKVLVVHLIYYITSC